MLLFTVVYCSLYVRESDAEETIEKVKCKRSYMNESSFIKWFQNVFKSL